MSIGPTEVIVIVVIVIVLFGLGRILGDKRYSKRSGDDMAGTSKANKK